jgi:hypothetical protein
VTLADDTQDGRAADAEGPTIARARVSVGLSLSLENDPRGRTLGVGEESADLVYRWPPVSPSQERDLSVAYTAHTARRVFRGPLRLLILAARLHGPDTVSLLRELYEEGGVQDLLARVIAYPPRLDPHPDYAVSTEVPSEAAPHRPAAPSPAASAHVSDEGEADRVAAIAPPFGLENQEPTRDEKKCSGDGADLGAWCGCPEAHLRPNVLYCEDHRPRFGSAPKLRYDRRISNPAAAGFLAAAATGQSAAGAPRP